MKYAISFILDTTDDKFDLSGPKVELLEHSNLQLPLDWGDGITIGIGVDMLDKKHWVINIIPEVV